MTKVSGTLLAALLLGAPGCDGSSGDGDDLDHEDSGADASAPEDASAPADLTPPACAHDLTLAPSSPGIVASETIAATEVPAAGLDICLHLDGTANDRNHFAASTDQEPGDTSSFALVLVDLDGDVLVSGWDVTFGAEDPSTFASLETGPWSPETPKANHLADVALRVTTKDSAPHTTSIDVALFDPLE
jgi:hypothetical protein